jgi:SanA protein
MKRFLFFTVLLVFFVAIASNLYVFAYSRGFVLKEAPESVDQIVVTNSSSVGPKSAIPDDGPWTALLLGASVYSDGTLSPVLEERADTAIYLYKYNVVSKILVSGDNSTRSYNEVIPTREYILSAGVPAEDVFVDYAGFDTYDSLYRARDIFEVSNLLVVTQAFHIRRAVFIARRLGLVAYGVPAGSELAAGTDSGVDKNTRGQVGVKNQIREFFAIAKAVFETATDAKPRFLGAPIPIGGDGRGSLD